jgi:hypothetical protein
MNGSRITTYPSTCQEPRSTAFQELDRCVSNLTDGRSYEDALTEAQRAGLAERDPAADVEGHDARRR